MSFFPKQASANWRKKAGSVALPAFRVATYLARLLHAIGITPRVPYSMQPTPPLGVAQVWSLAFWGGVWGVALAAVLRRYVDGALVIARGPSSPP